MSGQPAMSELLFQQLRELSDHLAARRASILSAWRAASEADPRQTSMDALTRTQFNDHIPPLLDALEEKLCARPGSEKAEESREDQKRQETKHGAHRWQQGYRLGEITREWGLLHLCLCDELEHFGALRPDVLRETLGAAHREVIKLINRAIHESAAQYNRLERETAAGRARDLERALAELSEWEQQRGQLIREVVHDLGGKVQAVTTAASLLSVPTLPEQQRQDVTDVVRRGARSLRTMLGDLMDLARLEAGEERRNIAPFDASVSLTELCEGSRPLAEERGLNFVQDGPASLPVVGDAENVQRIVQNLVLNALKYTESGGVTVSWGEEDSDTWWLAVRDTGPGLPGKSVHAPERRDSGKSGATSPPHVRSHGEGIGLAIVKRLCELLEATMQVESSADEGTMFRVVLPRSYCE